MIAKLVVYRKETKNYTEKQTKKKQTIKHTQSDEQQTITTNNRIIALERTAAPATVDLYISTLDQGRIHDFLKGGSYV